MDLLEFLPKGRRLSHLVRVPSTSPDDHFGSDALFPYLILGFDDSPVPFHDAVPENGRWEEESYDHQAGRRIKALHPNVIHLHLNVHTAG